MVSSADLVAVRNVGEVSSPPQDRPDRPVAAIDIGTNSIHLLLAQPRGGNRFETIATEKEMVRLGSGAGDMKTLQPDSIDRAVAALQRFRKIAEISDAKVRAVATSAVREAENRADFLRRAKDEAGIDVEVIAGAEEARLIHLGVLQAVPVYDRRVLLIDIGGGSTEFLAGHGSDVLYARSVKLGAIRLTERFFRHEPVGREQVKACRAHVRSYLSAVARELRPHPFEVAVGSSGTIQSVAEMVLAGRREGEADRTVGNEVIERDEVDEVVRSLKSAPTAKERAKVPGLDARRADIILGGAVLLQEAMRAMSIDRLTVSPAALREGLLLDTLHRAEAASLHHLGDIRMQSVQHLADLVPQDRQHGEHARRLALQLFDDTQAQHGLGEEWRELLEAAALLANVGLVISHDRHHLHSYYVIRNAEQLTGFTEREVELIAQVARYHRKSAPKAKHPDFARLDKADQAAVEVLAGILRVAIALDRTYEGLVQGVSATIKGQVLLLALDESGDTSLERYTAEERKGLLEAALGLSVVLAPPAGMAASAVLA